MWIKLVTLSLALLTGLSAQAADAECNQDLIDEVGTYYQAHRCITRGDLTCDGRQFGTIKSIPIMAFVVGSYLYGKGVAADPKVRAGLDALKARLTWDMRIPTLRHASGLANIPAAPAAAAEPPGALKQVWQKQAPPVKGAIAGGLFWLGSNAFDYLRASAASAVTPSACRQGGSSPYVFSRIANDGKSCSVDFRISNNPAVGRFFQLSEAERLEKIGDPKICSYYQGLLKELKPKVHAEIDRNQLTVDGSSLQQNDQKIADIPDIRQPTNTDANGDGGTGQASR